MPASGGKAAAQSSGWTTLSALRQQSERAWDKGDLLRELLAPTGAYPRRRPLKHPTAAQLRDNYGAARDWAAELHVGATDFTLESVSIGRTTIGANKVPAGALFAAADDEIAFLGHQRKARRFLELAARLEQLDPTLRHWALKRPLALLELDEAALTAAAVAAWLRDHPAPGIYVRQLSLPNVHTKFVASHRRTIDEMAILLRSDAAGTSSVPPPPAAGTATAAGEPDALMEPGAPPAAGPVSGPGTGFAARHGFLSPPELVRFRVLDPSIPLLGAARDLSVTAEAFASLELPVQRIIVTENLVNFLALPELPGTMALFGAGYGFSALRHAAWLKRCETIYWGDIDTHGFQILDQLRSGHPHVRSVMMDTGTFLAHRQFWGREAKPSSARLTRLTADEAELYTALVNDEHGPALRLEQEQIPWDWALGRLASARR
ncbi:hypothetical protein D477_004671 [Arthrobacter crystallopoietes BAB-32]|uniref:Wadjet protein JetD C-terminal domain-containing protein n=1 Tax=Arthrobacter crystallopoietes BAB-32 TaxID=1246476 RepID=N1UYB5_9MICC|nr:DUF3322 and DUF2220 domain-containing protein [Arthrobacter crystallopoietes]EMY35366.1 hypothetical protein D477_004671 [Arthrobacter crystallopoietes BAB-32]